MIGLAVTTVSAKRAIPDVQRPDAQSPVFSSWRN